MSISEHGFLGYVGFIVAAKIIAKNPQIIIDISIIKCSIKFKKPCGHVALSHLLTLLPQQIGF